MSRRRLLRRSAALALTGAGMFGNAADATEFILPLHIARRKIDNTPTIIRVRVGDRVELRWTTDEATTVHLHGYDVKLTLDPATEGRMRFDADATGRYPISAHGFGAAKDKSAQREIVLLYLEVHPR